MARADKLAVSGIGVASREVPRTVGPAKACFPPTNLRRATRRDGETAWRLLSDAAPLPENAARHSPASQALALDQLLRRLLDETSRYGQRRIAISSARRGAGRTTLLARLAHAAARVDGIRVIALDLDLDRPALGRMLGARPVTGLAAGFDAVLAGRVAFAAVARRLGATMAYGPVHTRPADPAALLAAADASDAMAQIEARYAPDLILCDTPPLCTGAIARAALAQCHAALLLVEAGRTTTRELVAARAELSGSTRVIGTVMTKAGFPF